MEQVRTWSHLASHLGRAVWEPPCSHSRWNRDGQSVSGSDTRGETRMDSGWLWLEKAGREEIQRTVRQTHGKVVPREQGVFDFLAVVELLRFDTEEVAAVSTGIRYQSDWVIHHTWSRDTHTDTPHYCLLPWRWAFKTFQGIELNWIGIKLNWIESKLNWIELYWFELNLIKSNWNVIELNSIRIELNQIKSNCNLM